MRIVAAIPNYNATNTLVALVGQLAAEKFDKIFILDDFSTNQAPLRKCAALDRRVEIILGKKNLGPGANRNRIMTQTDADIVFFIDADMELRTSDLLPKIEASFRDEGIGIVGYNILNKKGELMEWNFGPEMHPAKDLQAELIYYFLKLPLPGSLRRRLIKAGGLYSDGRRLTLLKRRRVDWVAEGCFAIRLGAFRAIGGYDEAMRYHETHDLGHRMRDSGYRVVFDPVITARHLELSVRKDRRADRLSARRYFMKKYHARSVMAVVDRLLSRQ
jgi:GT2 family glycosyltransferase